MSTSKLGNGIAGIVGKNAKLKSGNFGSLIPIGGGNGILGKEKVGKLKLKPGTVGRLGRLGNFGSLIPIGGGNGIAGKENVGRLKLKSGILGKLGKDGRLGSLIPIGGGNGIAGKSGNSCRIS